MPRKSKLLLMRILIDDNLRRLAEYAGQEPEAFATGFLVYLNDEIGLFDESVEYVFDKQPLSFSLDASGLDVASLFQGYANKALPEAMEANVPKLVLDGYRCPDCGSINVVIERTNFEEWSRDGYDYECTWDEIIKCKDCGNELTTG